MSTSFLTLEDRYDILTSNCVTKIMGLFTMHLRILLGLEDCDRKLLQERMKAILDICKFFEQTSDLNSLTEEPVKNIEFPK